MAAYKARGEKKVTLSDPYLSFSSSDLQITIAKYLQLSSRKLDAVIAHDINMQWEVFEQIFNDMPILSHYYLIDQKNSTLLHSRLDTKYLRQVFKIS